MDRPAHPTHFKLLKKTQKAFRKESLWQGLKSVLSMWLRQTEWSLVTVLIVTPVQTVNSAQESLKASLSGERGFCKCQMTWQKVKKTLNILHCSACKFRTKTPRNLLATRSGTNYFLMLQVVKTQPSFPSPHNQDKLTGHFLHPSLPEECPYFQSSPLTSFLGWEGGISLALIDGFGTKFGDYPWTLSQPWSSPRALIACELTIEEQHPLCCMGVPPLEFLLPGAFNLFVFPAAIIELSILCSFGPEAEIRELFYTPNYGLFPIAIKPWRDRSRKYVVRWSVSSSSLLASPYCFLKLQAECPPDKTVLKDKGYLLPHRKKSLPTPAESRLKLNSAFTEMICLNL